MQRSKNVETTLRNYFKRTDEVRGNSMPIWWRHLVEFVRESIQWTLNSASQWNWIEFFFNICPTFVRLSIPYSFILQINIGTLFTLNSWCHTILNSCTQTSCNIILLIMKLWNSLLSIVSRVLFIVTFNMYCPY